MASAGLQKEETTVISFLHDLRQSQSLPITRAQCRHVLNLFSYVTVWLLTPFNILYIRLVRLGGVGRVLSHLRWRRAEAPSEVRHKRTVPGKRHGEEELQRLRLLGSVSFLNRIWHRTRKSPPSRAA